MSTNEKPQDLLGRDMTDTESRLLDAWQTLRALEDEDLPPVAEAGVKEASAALWVVVNGLALTADRPE